MADIGWQGRGRGERGDSEGAVSTSHRKKEGKKDAGKGRREAERKLCIWGCSLHLLPLCVCFSTTTSRSAPGPLWAWSRQARQRRTRKKRLAAICLSSWGWLPEAQAAVHPEGPERGLLQGQPGLRARDPVWSSTPSALSPSADPEQRTATPEVPSHPPATLRGTASLGVLLPRKVRHRHQNVKKGRWPCSSWINMNMRCQADCKLPTNLLSPHKHKSLCVHQGVVLPTGPGPDPCAFQTSTRVLYK